MALVQPVQSNTDDEFNGLAKVLQHRPELLDKYRTFYASFEQDALLPRRTLALCRRRIAHIQGCQAELSAVDTSIRLSDEEAAALANGDSGLFSSAEQAALAVAECMPFGVHHISDEQVQAVCEAYGHPGCVALLAALSFFDVNCRLKVVFETDTAAHPRLAGDL